jgi:hypothetical protein
VILYWLLAATSAVIAATPITPPPAAAGAALASRLRRSPTPKSRGPPSVGVSRPDGEACPHRARPIPPTCPNHLQPVASALDSPSRPGHRTAEITHHNKPMV